MKFIIEHLSKGFDKKEVLRDINFSFEEGKIYGLLTKKCLQGQFIIVTRR